MVRRDRPHENLNQSLSTIQNAVDGIRARGNSWAYIALATGKTREAAYQKWGKK